MEEKFIIGKNEYSVRYNETAISNILEQIGVCNKRKLVEFALVCYACANNKLNLVWEALALKTGLARSTVAVHIRNALIGAEYNGGLKNIDDILGVEFYDYDFGLTSKNFLAVLSRHLLNQGSIIVKIVEK